MLVKDFNVNDRKVVLCTGNGYSFTGYATMPSNETIVVYCQFYHITGLQIQVKLGHDHADLKVDHQYEEV